MFRDRAHCFAMIVLAVLALIQPVSAFRLDAQTISVMPSITSDTRGYCGELMDRISGMTRTAAMPPPIEAATLSEVGERMCMQGQTRGGISRLRRAIAIMRHRED